MSNEVVKSENSAEASHDGGKKSGLVGNAHQGGTTAQHETAGTQRWQSHGPEVELTIPTPLSQLRSETVESIADLEIELVTLMASGGGTDDEHDPDGSTLAYERSRASSLLAQARRSLEEIDTAIERLRTGNYGLCDKCGARSHRVSAEPVRVVVERADPGGFCCSNVESFGIADVDAMRRLVPECSKGRSKDSQVRFRNADDCRVDDGGDHRWR